MDVKTSDYFTGFELTPNSSPKWNAKYPVLKNTSHTNWKALLSAKQRVT